METKISARASGYLGERIHMIYDRLEEKEYWPDAVFKEGYSWPADWEGRIMLALVMLAKSTGRSPRYLEEMYAQIPEHLNSRGYFGEMLSSGEFDEQQLSGHSWFLRAMCELYEWKKGSDTLQIIRKIVDELLLPTKGYYSIYPSDPQERVFEGEAVGNVTGKKVNHWYPSTDIGCAFIMLDGATHAYKIVKIPALKELIEEMIEKFLSIDLLQLSFQTHATLTAARGILRFYAITQEKKWLESVQYIYDLYKQQGMTINYSNYNWFNRPTWTEPCAVVDSYLVAFDLWKHTGEFSYLEDAHYILYNGLGYAQRPNGGFGCDTCSGTKDVYVSPIQDLFEASWCCSMRGGDGLARANQFLSQFDGQNLIFPFYNESILEIETDEGTLLLKQETEYPHHGQVNIVISKCDLHRSLGMKLYIPSWVPQESIQLKVNNRHVDPELGDGWARIDKVWVEGDVIDMSFTIPFRQHLTEKTTHLQDYHYYHHGALLLGVKTNKKCSLPQHPHFSVMGKGVYKEKETGVILEPIHDLIDQHWKDAHTDQRQILF